MTPRDLRLFRGTLLICMFIGLLGTLQAQEIPTSHFPVAPPRIGEMVVYRAFLHHLATFENLAQKQEQQGLSGRPLRMHFVHKFGLTESEQSQIAQIALNFQVSVEPIRKKHAEAVAVFQAQHFTHGRYVPGAPLPPASPDLLASSRELNRLTLDAQNQIKAILGKDRFASLNTEIHNHVQPINDPLQKGN